VVQASSPAWLGAGQRPAPQYENGQLIYAQLLSVPEVLQWIVAADEDALRFDAFLVRHLSSVSRREIIDLIASGQALLNDRPRKKGTLVRAGDKVSVPALFSLRPNPTLPVRVAYADAALVVLDKPAGIPSLALRHSETNTVANFLTARFPETLTAGPHPLEAGLVHRIDTVTSGLLLAARTPYAYTSLRQQFHARAVEKAYLAAVEGHLRTDGQATFWLAPEGPRGQRMRVVAPGQGQEALTTYTPLEALPGHTLVRLTIATGVRHQIRAHLAALGHPIVGDTVYGAAEEAERLCLHAETLVFRHPLTGQRLRFDSPVPQDFSAVVERLRGLRKS
jgi:23S rRNA pseudouridine1911/1915/1917 synthase